MLEKADRSMIVLTGDPAERYWQLGAFPAGDGLGVMAGWTLESPGGGVPAKVARVLAGAMARYGRITFPCSVGSLGSGDSWQMQGEDAVSRPAIAARGAWRRLLSRVAPAKIPLLSTRREDAALDLYDDPSFQRWNASQSALVSRPPDVPPPHVSPLPFEHFEENWPNAIALLQAAGVEIIMRSGVDGDVCGLAFCSNSARSEFEGMLHTVAADCGLAVRTLSNAAFGQILPEALSI